MYLDFVQERIHIPFYSNLTTSSLGMDSRDQCFNRKLFDQFGPVTYQFNEIGYRTHSVHNFDPNAILLLGDSFTLGLGVNSVDRYSDILENQLKQQILNFSLNGASNDWISRKLDQLLKKFDPPAIIIHYTFSHRRERPNSDWFDDERTECEPDYSCQENFENWLENFNKITSSARGIKTIHSFIPKWHNQVVQLNKFSDTIVPLVPQIDLARDGFHYGPKTHVKLAQMFTNLLVS